MGDWHRGGEFKKGWKPDVDGTGRNMEYREGQGARNILRREGGRGYCSVGNVVWGWVAWTRGGEVYSVCKALRGILSDIFWEGSNTNIP